MSSHESNRAAGLKQKTNRGAPLGNQNARKYEKVEQNGEVKPGKIESPKITYSIENKKGVLRLYRDAIHWTIEGRLPDRRAGVLAHLLDGYMRALMPTVVEERLDDLEKQAQRTRKVIADRIGMEIPERINEPTASSETCGSRKVDVERKDS